MAMPYSVTTMSTASPGVVTEVHLVQMGGNSAPNQWRYDNGAFGTGSRIRMSARGAPNDSIGAHHYIAVKVHIHFQRAQDYKIQFVDKSALVHGVGVLGGGNFIVIGIVLDGFDRAHIKGLGIHDALDKAVIQQITHRLCDAADGKAHGDSLFFQDGAEHHVHSQGSASSAGLEGKARP